MRKFIVYIDDSEACFKLAISAETAKKAAEQVRGNGEIIAIKDVTDDYPIDLSKVKAALEKSEFGRLEIDWITNTLNNVGLAEW